MNLTRERLDDVFPTLVRYVGLAVTLVLIGFALAGFYVQAAVGLPAAGGMLLYKTLHNAVKTADRPKRPESPPQGYNRDDDNDEGFTHMSSPRG